MVEAGGELQVGIENTQLADSAISLIAPCARLARSVSRFPAFHWQTAQPCVQRGKITYERSFAPLQWKYTRYGPGTHYRQTSRARSNSKRLTLFSLAGLRLRIVDILEMPVDLADRRTLKDPVKARAEREAVLVF